MVSRGEFSSGNGTASCHEVVTTISAEVRGSIAAGAYAAQARHAAANRIDSMNSAYYT